MIKNKRIKLRNIDGLGDFNQALVGIVIMQYNQNSCKVRLDRELNYKGAKIEELNITTRHKGGNLNKIILRGIRKIFNIPPIIAVTVVDKDNKVGFIAEISVEL